MLAIPPNRQSPGHEIETRISPRLLARTAEAGRDTCWPIAWVSAGWSQSGGANADPGPPAMWSQTCPADGSRIAAIRGRVCRRTDFWAAAC